MMFFSQDTSDDLTPRESEVAQLLMRGYSNPQIAAELGIARETAKCHVSRILWKLGVSTRSDAAILLRSRGGK